MKATIKRRLEHLAARFGPSEREQMQAGLQPPKNGLCVLVRLVFGTPDLTKSKCQRTLSPEGHLLEYVTLLDSQGNLSGHDGLSEEALHGWIASHPIELEERDYASQADSRVE